MSYNPTWSSGGGGGTDNGFYQSRASTVTYTNITSTGVKTRVGRVVKPASASIKNLRADYLWYFTTASVGDRGVPSLQVRSIDELTLYGELTLPNDAYNASQLWALSLDLLRPNAAQSGGGSYIFRRRLGAIADTTGWAEGLLSLIGTDALNIDLMLNMTVLSTGIDVVASGSVLFTGPE